MHCMNFLKPYKLQAWVDIYNQSWGFFKHDSKIKIWLIDAFGFGVGKKHGRDGLRGI